MSETFRINASDPTPLHAQLSRAIRFALATGSLRVGDQLPTVRQLAVSLRVNANTVAKVYAELERAGVLETRRGVGTFVRERQPAAVARRDRQQHLRELADRFIAEAHHYGYTLDEVLEHLQGRRQKEKRKNG